MALPSIDLDPFLREEGVIVNEPPTDARLSVSRKIDKAVVKWLSAFDQLWSHRRSEE
jgi:hypothetical protein